MARKYDKLIRFYASWLYDLTDIAKGFSDEEIVAVITAIWRSQEDGTTRYIDELPIVIKRGLQVCTLKEQIERIIERTHRMSSRGRLGGLATAGATAGGASEVQPPISTGGGGSEPVERNTKGLHEVLSSFGLTDDEIRYIMQHSNYGQIGHPVWQMIAKARSAKSPRAYILACLGRDKSNNYYNN